MRTELVTTLKKQATRILAELRESKEPILITEHCQPSSYLLDVSDYEYMVRRMEILEGIARGEQDIREVLVNPCRAIYKFDNETVYMLLKHIIRS